MKNNHEPVELATFASEYDKVYGMISHYKLSKRALKFRNDKDILMNFEYINDENIQIDRGQFIFIRMNYGNTYHSVNTVSSNYTLTENTFLINDDQKELKEIFLKEFLTKTKSYLDKFDYKLFLQHAFLSPMECNKDYKNMRCELKIYIPKFF
ncbi:MAG: hypothetical protein H6622_15500 [Halobacteriovoraceae bacterium]|nr:hypothetical protein [Halobacteriovoraceae bacterium]